MTKRLPTGCIKQNLDTSWRTFNLILQNVSLNDQIDIELDYTKATEKLKDQSISCSNNIPQRKKEIQEHIEQLKMLM